MPFVPSFTAPGKKHAATMEVVCSDDSQFMPEDVPEVLEEKGKKSRWKLPLGLMATGVAGAAVLVFRGCWHRKMSWPVRSQDHSYQVCLGCGIKRLFDEKSFRAYGPYSYDLNKLIAWETRRSEQETPQQRPA